MVRKCPHCYSGSCYKVYCNWGTDKFKYKKEDIVVLIDTPEDPKLLTQMGLDNKDNFAPTRDNIVGTTVIGTLDYGLSCLARSKQWRAWLRTLSLETASCSIVRVHRHQLKPNTCLIVLVAGHGGQIQNVDGTEVDGYDEGQLSSTLPTYGYSGLPADAPSYLPSGLQGSRAHH